MKKILLFGATGMAGHVAYYYLRNTGRYDITNVVFRIPKAFDKLQVEHSYITKATVTMNLIVAAAIVLLNLYVGVSVSCRIPCFVWSTDFPDVVASIYAGADPGVPHGSPFYDRAFGL